jgi:hypothetical protein
MLLPISGVHLRFVHLFKNCVPSLRKSFGTSASSCNVSDISTVWYGRKGGEVGIASWRKCAGGSGQRLEVSVASDYKGVKLEENR